MIARLVVWFALVFATVDILQFAIRSLLLEQLLFISPLYVWMAPAANLSILSMAGIAPAVLSAWRPRLVTINHGVVVFSFLCWSGLLISAGSGVHHLALFILAAGLAVSSARLVSARPRGFQTLVRHSSRWMCAGIALATVGVHGSSWLGERGRIAQLPEPPPGAPNVLLIVLDTVRADRLSTYGYPEATSPQLTELAAGGAVFERAMATAPWTLPSHATMLTGLYPKDWSADWKTPLDDAAPTVAEVLSRQLFSDELFGRKSAATINRDVLAWHTSVGQRPANPTAPAAEDSAVLSTVSQGVNSPATVPVSRGDMVSIVADGWHCIRDGKGTEELYGFDSDVAEANNAAESPEAADALVRIRERLRRIR